MFRGLRKVRWDARCSPEVLIQSVCLQLCRVFGDKEKKNMWPYSAWTCHHCAYLLVWACHSGIAENKQFFSLHIFHPTCSCCLCAFKRNVFIFVFKWMMTLLEIAPLKQTLNWIYWLLFFWLSAMHTYVDSLWMVFSHPTTKWTAFWSEMLRLWSTLRWQTLATPMAKTPVVSLSGHLCSMTRIDQASTMWVLSVFIQLKKYKKRRRKNLKTKITAT